MKGYKRLFFLTALLICLLACARAETARVLTPGGGLNMRKKADAKSALVDSVPNRALVEVLEIDDAWTKVIYQKKTGYVKTEFLKLPANLPGKTVYADAGTLLIRQEPAKDAPILLPVGAMEGVLVESVAGEWALVRCGQMAGYVEIAAISYQYEEPVGEMTWVRQEGVTAAACQMRAAPKADAPTVAALEAGADVTVTEIGKEYCLVVAQEGCGYVLPGEICLKGAPDGEARTGSLSPMEAAERAEAALKKKYRAFGKGKFYFTADVPAEGQYGCCFFNEEDQFLYGALVDAQSGKVIFAADYTAFAVPPDLTARLPHGEVAVELSAEVLAIGDVLDIRVSAWTGYQCQYDLRMGETSLAACEPGEHFTAAYRVREAGEYTLTVTVTDEEGYTAQAERIFRVDDSLPQGDPFQRVYSQKDGWWLDKIYRTSNLDRSGCAIFALSCALQRMGFTGEDVLPERLAKAYALCLTPEGTNNERLVREAGNTYGYTYKAQITRDQKWIVNKLKSGALFSFSVARGHIALIDGLSEDGTMAHIVDSAPTATFTRIVGDSLYYQMRSGSFRAALSLDDIPGARWYFETDHYGGLEYWLRIPYVVKRGVRLIEPQED